MNETMPIVAASSIPSSDVIAVAVIEDNRLVREGIIALLNRFPDIEVVAGEPDGRELLRKRTDPRVILLDLGLENGDSLRVARKVRKDFANARVIVMDLLPAEEEIMEFVGAGVSGFVLKDATLDDLVHTIRSVAAGIEVLPTQMTSTLFSQIAREAVSGGGLEQIDSARMTPREREVINLISEGLSNKAIARELNIAIHTVKSHVRNVMEKLALHTRLQIAAYVHRRDSGS